MNYNYLNNIINKLVDETIMDDQGRQTHTPFGSFPYFYHLSILEPFMNHCRDVYGLTSEEIKYAWVKYRSIIDTKIKRGRSLNESQELNYKFLDRIIAQLVDETIIEKGKILSPFCSFFGFWQLPFPSSHPLSPRDSFDNYCKDTYGLNAEEIKYVWQQYKNSVNNKREF